MVFGRHTLGGKVKGGKVYGEWPGLSDDQHYHDRDLVVVTDCRQVLAAVLTRHLKLSDAALERVFPDGIGAGANVGGLIT